MLLYIWRKADLGRLEASSFPASSCPLAPMLAVVGGLHGVCSVCRNRMNSAVPAPPRRCTSRPLSGLLPE
jgi:hypothetical protein